MPTLVQARTTSVHQSRRKPRTVEMYRQNLRVCFGVWLTRSHDAIDRRDVEACIHRVTELHGWATANQAIAILHAIYRRSRIDHEGLRNPVELWITAGGRLNRKPRRRISSPAEVLLCWGAGWRRWDSRFGTCRLPDWSLYRHAPGSCQTNSFPAEG